MASTDKSSTALLPGSRSRWPPARLVAGRILRLVDINRHGRVVLGILLAVLTGSSALYLVFDHRAHWREAEQRAAVINGAVAQYVEQVFTSVELTLQSVDDDRSDNDIVVSWPPARLHEALRHAQAAMPALQGLGVVGADGRIVAGAASPDPPPVDLSDRDYFLEHRDRPDIGLLVSRPVMSRPHGLVTVPVSRRIVGPGGIFNGVVAARLDPQHFSNFFSAIGADSVAVLRPDGVFVGRYPQIDLVAQAPVPATLPFMDRTRPDARGVYVAVSGADGVERLTSYRRIRAPELIVLVSFETAGILGAWVTRSYPFFALFIGGFVLLCILAAIVRRQARDAEAVVAATSAARVHAEHLAEAKSAFLANMSHEIRTPLGGVLGYADLLLQSGLDAQRADWTRKLRAAGSQLLAVINDILDYSKLESGEFSVTTKAVALAALVDEVHSMTAPEAQRRGLALQVFVDEALPPWIRTDPVRLTQILINLVGNAVKFTDKGWVSVEVRPASLPDGRAAVRLTVADTGIGIPENKVEAVFERFTQADTQVGRGRGGTGLGLPISRRLAELMGGSLALESRVGHGTTVEVLLPLVPASTPATAVPATPTAARPGRILLVDDLAMNLEIAGAMLRSQGHTVVTTANGLEAIDLALSADFDAILLDVNLPDIDGYEVAREIRKLESGGRRTPILALTANALPEHVEAALAAGMDGHLSKPLDESAMAAQLSRVLAAEAADGSDQGLDARTVPLIDRRAVASLERLLGAGRVAAMQAEFWSGWPAFAEMLSPGATSRSDLGFCAHDMVSLAGNVGYLRLAEACRRLSAAADGEDDFGSAIERVRAAAEETRRLTVPT